MMFGRSIPRLCRVGGSYLQTTSPLNQGSSLFHSTAVSSFGIGLRSAPSSLSLQQQQQQRSYATEEKKALESFTANLFCGRVSQDQCFPYPEALREEDYENLPIIIDSTEKFFQEKNDALANDLAKDVPPEVMDGLKELGAFGIQVPLEYGGVGLKNTGYARITEVVGKYDLAIGIVMGAHQSIGFKGILLVGNEEQKAKYLPPLASGEKIAAFALTEPSSGSDAQSISTRAVQNADGTWTLNGSKIWISNGGFADVFTVFAKTEVDDPKTGEKKDKVTAFIVERAFGGVTSGPPEDKMGIRASNTAAVTFEDCVVPNENVLGEVGKGFKVAMQILNNGRFGMGSTLAGTCKQMISVATAHANERKQFGKNLKDFGMIQEKIAMMTLQTYALESMAYLVSSIMDGGSDDYQLEAAICKIFGTETATFVSDECLQILAGMGYMRETGVEKVVRDLRIFRIFEGTNEILRLLVALTGVQQAGTSLKELQGAMKNPLSNIGLLMSAALKRVPGTSGLRPPPAAIPCHPDVAPSARLIEKNAVKFGDTVEALLIKHRKGIVDEQIVLKRLADVAIQVFSMAATTSRATRALEKNLPSAGLEVQLCNSHCQVANNKIEILFSELSGKNADKNIKQISDFVFENGYQVSSPIGLDN